MTTRHPRLLWSLVALAALSACGESSPPTTPGGDQTVSFNGTARGTSPTGCGGDNHRISAGEGAISVTLVQSMPSVPLIVQLCAPSAADHSRDCSINRQRIEVGQTLRGAVTGGRTQDLALNPSDCASGAPPQNPTITYTVSVVHPR